ncbi:MAG: sulfatase-like hydrolase/transferase [Candidatus Obscuribacterales bacterium]|nr:sulfatase-like hydrolase/transferase [Candidatus Obscuribacterales bacterium]
MAKLNEIPLYPVAAGILPVLVTYNIRGANHVALQNLLPPLIVSALLSVIVYAFFRQLWTNRIDNAPICAWLALTTLFAFTYVVIGFDFCLMTLSIKDAGFAIIAGQIFISLAVALTLAIIFALITQKTWLKKIDSLVCRATGFLLILQLVVLFQHEFNYFFAIEPQVAIAQAEMMPKIKTSKTTSRRDIYMIVLDEMASPEVLSRVFAYDNSDFVSQLRQRGFLVDEASLSNYPLTRLSLASILNMSYLDFLGDTQTKQNQKDYAPTTRLLQRSNLAKFLQQQGYDYIHIGSEMPPTDSTVMANQNRYPLIDEFSLRFWQSTTLGQTPGFSNFLAHLRRKSRLDAIKYLEMADAGKRPKFVLCHILCPHEPFDINADGSPRQEIMPNRVESAWDAEARSAYLGQVKFIEKRILTAIDNIIEKSKNQPIIVLQGDHGTYAEDEMAKDFPKEELYQERYGILNAYLVPSDMKEKIYRGITPVNSFRVILSELFGADLPALADRQIYATYGQPFKFRDVSDRVRKLQAALK